jgi:site-specific DNA recombinase
MKVGIYSRVSKDKQGADRSLPLQESDGKDFAESKGYLFEYYTEKEGTSGTKTADERPELYRMLHDVKEGRLNAIFAYEISRFERNDNDRYLIFKTLNDAKAELYTKRDGFVDFTRPEIKLQLDILGATNSYMVALTKAKVKDTLNKNVSEGRKHSAPALGYTADENKMLVVNPDTSPLIERIFQLSIDGNGSQMISKILSDEGIPTPTNLVGKKNLTYRTKNLKEKVTVDKSKLKWNHVTVNRILKNPLYKGQRHWNDEVYSVAPIVSEEVWNAAQEAIKKNKNNSVNNTAHEYLLAGKVFCGNCGCSYTGYTSVQRDVHIYQCSNRRKVNTKVVEKCSNKRVDQYVIEDIVWQRVIGNPLLLKVLRKEFDFDNLQAKEDYSIEIDKLNKEISSKNNAKKKLITMAGNDIISEDDLAEQLPSLNAEIREIQKNLGEIEAKQAVISNRQEVFDEVVRFQEKLSLFENPSFEIMRKLVNVFIDRVVVNYNANDKLTELQIRLKLNLEYHSLSEDMSIDLKQYKKESTCNINRSRRAPGF